MRILLIPVSSGHARFQPWPRKTFKEFLGRWDMTVTPATGQPYPQWMELTENGGQN